MLSVSLREGRGTNTNTNTKYKYKLLNTNIKYKIQNRNTNAPIKARASCSNCPPFSLSNLPRPPSFCRTAIKCGSAKFVQLSSVRLQPWTAEGREGCFCVNNRRNCWSHPHPRHTGSGSHEQLCRAVSKCLSAAVYK